MQAVTPPPPSPPPPNSPAVPSPPPNARYSYPTAGLYTVASYARTTCNRYLNIPSCSTPDNKTATSTNLSPAGDPGNLWQFQQLSNGAYRLLNLQRADAGCWKYLLSCQRCALADVVDIYQCEAWLAYNTAMCGIKREPKSSYKWSPARHLLFLYCSETTLHGQPSMKYGYKICIPQRCLEPSLMMLGVRHVHVAFRHACMPCRYDDTSGTSTWRLQQLLSAAVHWKG